MLQTNMVSNTVLNIQGDFPSLDLFLEAGP